MRWSEVGDTLCPIARSLAIVGDRWTLLILRELFLGGRRFEEFQAQTGISPHLLSTRLKRLEAEGILGRRPYQDRPIRVEYRLTEKGQELYPVMLALKNWGETWGGVADGEAALTITHRGCGCETKPMFVCASCGHPLKARDGNVTLGHGFAGERQGRHDAFMR